MPDVSTAGVCFGCCSCSPGNQGTPRLAVQAKFNYGTVRLKCVAFLLNG
jgi:hypothetical protein